MIIDEYGLSPLQEGMLYAQMEREGRIRSNDYPQDWKYYTLTYPVASYAHLTWAELVEEVTPIPPLARVEVPTDKPLFCRALIAYRKASTALRGDIG